MRPKDQLLAKQLESGLSAFSQVHPLPGVEDTAHRTAFVEQLVDSIRRITYISKLRDKKLSDLRADPSGDLFDPIQAAVVRMRAGQIDESFWFVFLSVHFGKHLRTGWRLARDVYGRLGSGIPWTWAETSTHPKLFRQWLSTHETILAGGDGIARHFGNHHRYQSLDAWDPKGTGAAFESYVKWVGPQKSHKMFFEDALAQNDHDPKKTFDCLYKSMRAVVSFGRLARFDYLTMVGKLGLVAIKPGFTYLQGATGPRRGAQLLFGGSVEAGLRTKFLEDRLVELGAHLGVGMQELEDSLCNWQKNPAKFIPFRG